MYCMHAQNGASEATSEHMKSRGVPPDPPHTIYIMDPTFCVYPGPLQSFRWPVCKSLRAECRPLEPDHPSIMHYDPLNYINILLSYNITYCTHCLLTYMSQTFSNAL